MNTRICAIAKDEGAYLAEWVFHHIYFGFDKLHIYINRTTDASTQILDAIARRYPQVSYEKLDWIDNCTPDVTKRIQIVAYGKDLHVAQTEGDDWWMCLDIDEFWVPQDFETPIGEFVTQFSDIQPICFLWHNVRGESQPFTPLAPDSHYDITPQVKTITPIKVSPIKFVRIHKPKYHLEVTPINADGETMIFSTEVDQRADRMMRSSYNAYIVHQMYRSEPEYLASMLRGNPEGRFALKTNRPGYKAKNINGKQRTFSWPKESYSNYIEAKDEFFNSVDLEDIIEGEKDNVLRNSKIVGEIVMSKLDKKSIDDILKSLTGTHLHSQVKSYKENDSE